MMFDDVLWCFLMFYDVLWCFMMFSDVLWCFLMFYDVFDVFWYLMMFYDVFWRELSSLSLCQRPQHTHVSIVMRSCDQASMLHRLGDTTGDVWCRSVCGSVAAAPHFRWYFIVTLW
jgi:hypothetical protein